MLPHTAIRETLVAVMGALTLAYTAWGLGGVLAWSLHVMLLGGLLTLALALLPVRARGRSGWGALLRLPATYCAAAFLLYLLLGALNPAWEIASDQRGWWLREITPPLAGWLPTSVQSNYEPMNAWRILHMHLAAFSLALGLRIGLTRRRQVRLVLWTFVLSTSAMAVVAIVQKYTGSGLVLGRFPSENSAFWGSFFYRNQAVAFLNWGIVLAGVLYFNHARRARQNGQSGGPHFLAACLIALLAVSVALALSRGGILFGGFLVAVFLLFAVADYLRHSVAELSRHTLWVTAALTLTLTLLLVGGLFQAYRAVDWDAVKDRFGDIETTIEEADSDARFLSSRMTWKMAQHALWTGWGAGSFRYAFPMYQREEPRLFYQRYHPRKGWIGRKFYRYAHNDLLQFLAEYGIVGVTLLLLALLTYLAPVLRGLGEAAPPSAFLLVGCLAAGGHACLDFIFHSPAYWVAFVAGTALVARLLQLEQRAARR